MAEKHDTTTRREGILTGVAVTFMVMLAFFGMMKPDPVMGRHAPLQVEAVR